MDPREILALFALVGVPVRPADAVAVAQAARRDRVNPVLLVAQCAAHTRERRLLAALPGEGPPRDSRRLVCAYGQVNEAGDPVVPTLVAATSGLYAGLRTCRTARGAINFANTGGCENVPGDFLGARAARYFLQIVRHRGG